MDKGLIHTPNGVRDIYGSEYFKKTSLIEKLSDAIKGFGYMNIETPSFEFFDVFGKEIGTNPSNELYKFFDRENNTLVLRSDFTPGVARAAAKYFMDESLPVRLTYSGNVFSNISALQGKLNETTQTGAELMGEPSAAADAEMIALTVECLKAAGLPEFQVTVGHADYFRGICDAAGIDEETENELRDYICGKNIFAIDALLKDREFSEDIKLQIRSIAGLFGGIEILDKAAKHAKNERSIAALDRLKELHGLLREYGVDKYVCFDLGMLSNYHYYTGIVFRAYTYGVGEAVAKGGRYDSLLEKFGKPSAAVGFVISIEELLNALNANHTGFSDMKKSAILVYEEKSLAKAISFASDIRKNGGQIELIPSNGTDDFEKYISFTKAGLVDEIYYACDNKIVKK